MAEPEEEVLLSHGLGRLGVGAQDTRRAFDEHLLADRVLPGIGAEVDRPAIDQILE